MDTRQLLDELLGAGRELADKGKEYAAKGEAYAADKLGVESNDTFRKGAVGGALAAGAMALLLGTGAGRAIGGAGLQLGGLAALGTLAYTAYKNYMSKLGETAEEPTDSVQELDGPAADARAETLLAAMISAAKADGHIDATEKEMIEIRMKGMSADMAMIERELSAPVDPGRIAAMSDSPAAAREIYAVSALAINADSPSERRYLDDLASALSLAPAVARAIEADMREEAA